MTGACAFALIACGNVASDMDASAQTTSDQKISAKRGADEGKTPKQDITTQNLSEGTARPGRKYWG